MEQETRMAQVGRLHLYLPPFRNRVSEDAPTAEEDIQLEWSGGSDEGGSSSGDNGSVERSREVKVNGYYYRHKAAQERERQRKLKRKIWFKEEANTFLSSSLPFWRRNSQEYIALVVSFLFLIAESLVRIITLALRMIQPPQLRHEVFHYDFMAYIRG